MEGEGALAAVVPGRSWISSGELCDFPEKKAKSDKPSLELVAGLLSVVLVMICCVWSAFCVRLLDPQVVKNGNSQEGHAGEDPLDGNIAMSTTEFNVKSEPNADMQVKC